MGRRGRPSAGMGSGPMVRGGRRTSAQKLGAGTRAKLQEAHQFKAGGQSAEAAARFDEVAGVASDRGFPRMASYLAAQAAQCHAKAGNQQGFLAATEKAIAEGKLEADSDHAARTFGELLAGLQDTGFAAAVPELEGAIRQALGVAPHPPGTAQPNRSRQRHLPSECEACGGKVSAELVKYNEIGQADCPYCSSILTA